MPEGVLSAGMSTLRRRFLAASSSEPSRDPSPVKGEPVTLVPTTHLKQLTKKRSRRRQWMIFGLGGLFGIVIAAFFAQRHDVINLEGLIDVNLESLLDVIPAGIVKDAKDLTVSRQCVGRYELNAEADTAYAHSAMNAKQSTTTPSVSGSMPNRKESKPGTPSS